jgi:hypothetical protein
LASHKKWSEEYFVNTLGNKMVVLNKFQHKQEKITRTILPKMTMEQAINTMRTNSDATLKYYILRSSLIKHYKDLLPDVLNPTFFDQDIFYSKDLWFGDARNMTPIHFDAVDNFVVPVFGTKTFYLYPKDDFPFIYPHNLKTKGRFNFSQCVSHLFDSNKNYPSCLNAKSYAVIIDPGDILYIPKGWWHEVFTHEKRSASLTYFFNKEAYTCLLWHFLGYQSCRLHEINDNLILEELLYSTNYDNWLQNAFHFLSFGQYWISVILIGAMLEQLIRLVVNEGYVELFYMVEHYNSEPICVDLMKSENWINWKAIILLAKMEDNEALKKYDLKKFIHEVGEFINKHLDSM